MTATLRKILVVDDNHAAADSMSKLLTLKGNAVQTAYSGKDAIDIANSFEPDLVLLDIGLGDIQGYEVAESLRNQGFKGHIVALTGYGQEEDIKKALSSGFNHHFTKPMGYESLEEYLIKIDTR